MFFYRFSKHFFLSRDSYLRLGQDFFPRYDNAALADIQIGSHFAKGSTNHSKSRENLSFLSSVL